jgi:hypothetical protein
VTIREDLWDAVKRAVLINETLKGMAGEVKGLAIEVRNLDRRLLKVEATLEYATKGGFRPHQPELPALPEKP